MGKKISMLICLSMVAGVLSSCGGGTVGTGDKTTKVTVWTGASHSKEVVEKLVNDYNNGEGKEKGIFIDYQVKGGDTAKQTLEVALQNGDAPDMFSMGSMQKMAELDQIASIEDLPGGEDFLKKYEDILVINKNIYNNKTYTVPVDATTQGLIYNKDMFKAAGIVDESGEAKPPTTYEELRRDAKLLTSAEDKKYGIIFPLKWGGWVQSDIQGGMMNCFGNDGFDPIKDEYDYTVVNPIMDVFLGIKEDGSFFPGADGLDNDPARAQFASGNVGMKFAFSFDVGVLNDQFPAECDWGVAPYPQLSETGKKYKQRMDYSSSPYINKKALDTIGAEKLLEVLKFFTDDEYVKKTYEEGVCLPYDWDIVKDIELKDAKVGWKEFAELVSISAVYPPAPSVDIGSEESLGVRFINDVWNGSKKPADITSEYTKVMNDGRAAYAELHPEYDQSIFKDPKWDISR